MSEAMFPTVERTPAGESDPVGQGHGVESHTSEHKGHGLSDKGYIRVAVVLAAITALEVAWSYLPVWDDARGFKHVVEVGGLLIMMAVKFVVVASNFMHLKFDDKLLTRVFYAGLLLAVSVYLIALFTFGIFL